MLTRLALLALLLAPASTERLALHAARLIDVERGELIEDALVIVEGASIVAAGARASLEVPEGASLIELGDLTLLPGLVDAHVHLAWGAGEAHANVEAPAPLSGAEEALATLRAGFTTVRNLGSTGFADLRLRDAIAAGSVAGPRMLVAGPALGAPGGTCDRVFAGEGVVRDEVEARARVRELAGRGVDVIKLCAGGGVLATLADEGACELSLEVMQAIVAEAHSEGLRVAAHAQGSRAIQNAVQAGVDSIEHGGLIDEPAAQAMEARGVVLVPTLARMEWSLANARASAAPAARLEALEAAGNLARERVARAIELGVPIACGTDASVLPHGSNARELRALVDAGLSPARSLRAVTVDAARLLGLEQEVGTIAAGMRADLVAVAGNPLEDVRVLESVAWVMSAGRIVKDER